MKKVILSVTLMGFLFSCSKSKQPGAEKPVGTVTKNVVVAAAPQPLPAGKRYFSVALANIDNAPWVRLGNWTFNPTNGTVAGTFWSWSSTEKHDVQILGTHRCTFDGVSKIVNNWTPYGWLGKPGGQYMGWTGNYTYDTTTDRLVINWTSGEGAGHTEQWNVSLPEPGLGRVKFVPRTSSYNVTHGRGYGSNTPWPDGTGNDHPARFKTILEVPTMTVTGSTGRLVLVAKRASGIVFNPAAAQTTPDTWTNAGWGTANMTTPSEPNPKNCKHKREIPTTNPCTGPCGTDRPGIIYHLSSSNTNRQMSWVNFCACLPKDGDTEFHFPGYGGNMHPHAQMQIIDDNSNMRGVIGMESQNPPSTGMQSSGYPNFQLQIYDYTLVPGS